MKECDHKKERTNYAIWTYCVTMFYNTYSTIKCIRTFLKGKWVVWFRVKYKKVNLANLIIEICA